METSMLHALDRFRRFRGTLMDAVGLGPDEAPYRLVSSHHPGFRLRAYGGPPSGPVLVIVPAPIKRAYIWDLAPDASAVRHGLAAGLRVYLVEWTVPDQATEDCGLAEYADRFIAVALDDVAADSGERRVLVTGHSLGGTLAAIFAALHPERVRGLVLLEAPLAFGPNTGPFAPLVAAAPPGRILWPAAGTVPGSFLNAVSLAAAPDIFAAGIWRDRLASLLDPDDARLHSRVVRWTLDEFPMPGRLFEDVVDDLYRHDRFARGCLRIGARDIGSRQLRMPILAVVDPYSTVVLPASTLSALAGDGLRLLHYTGDRGVALQHVGMLVGRSAHRTLWPAIHAWMRGCAGGPEGAPIDRDTCGPSTVTQPKSLTDP